MNDFDIFNEECMKEAKRLMHLKAAGRLLELPCEPGSAVYTLTEDNGCVDVVECTMGLLNIVENLPNFGDTIFTNYDDAVKAKNALEH